MLSSDKMETNIYFIKKGIVRADANSTNNEITFWFGKESDTVIAMKCYVENQRGYKKSNC